MGAWRDGVAFYTDKVREFRSRRVDPDLTDHPAHLKRLLQDGVVMVPDFLPPDVVGAIIDETRANTDLLTTRSSERVVKRNARYLLIDPVDLVPSSRVFFDHPVVRGLARSYLSADAVPDRPALQLKADVGAQSVVDFFHIDEWRYLISAFLLLTDVGPDEGPMEYLVGSHRVRPWRLRKEREFYVYYDRAADGRYRNEESAYCGCLLPTEARRLREKYGFRSVSCTGRRGTLILFDNLGLHRARPLRRNTRLLLSSYWMLPPRR